MTRPSHPPRPFLIEFLGMPGSGKTTIAGMLVEHLKDQGVVFSPDLTRDSWSRPWRICARLVLIVRELPRFIRIIPLLLSILFWPQTSIMDRLKSLFVCLTVAGLLTRIAQSRQSAILDQGPMQAVWSAMLMSPRPGETGKVLHGLKSLLPDHDWHVVHVDAPDHVLRQRLSERAGKHSRLQMKRAADQSQIWTRARANLTHLIKHLAPRAGETTADPIQIQTADQSAETSALQLLHHIAPSHLDHASQSKAPTPFTEFPIGGNPQGDTPGQGEHLLTCNTSSKNRT